MFSNEGKLKRLTGESLSALNIFINTKEKLERINENIKTVMDSAISKIKQQEDMITQAKEQLDRNNNVISKINNIIN